MKIRLSELEGPYSAVLDTEVMTVDVTEAYIGPTFTATGGTLALCERDGGWELTYATATAVHEIRCVNGTVETWSAEISSGEPDAAKGADQ